MQRSLLLIENYPPDRQRSMAQFGDLMAQTAREADWSVSRWTPPVVCGKYGETLSGLGKWLGYVDKYLLAILRFRRKWRHLHTAGKLPDLVHIVDHANAIYQKCFQGVPVLVTCHDLIAIRRARGEFLVPPPAVTGRLQQRWILSALKKCAHLSFVSEATKDDYKRITQRRDPNGKWPVVYPALAQDLGPIADGEAENRIQKAGLKISRRYIFHHGGATWYKNRETVIEVYLQVRSHHPELGLILGGAPLTEPLRKRLKAAGALDACLETGSVSAPLLEALYNQASVFLFPSWVEGFGWPPVEAQACGCPVVASNGGSLKEVLGHSAGIFDPTDAIGMAAAVLGVLEHKAVANKWREEGLRNVRRFSQEKMRKAYCDLYANLTCP